jgi:hypothetical protein
VDNNYLDLGMSKSGFIHTLPSGRLSCGFGASPAQAESRLVARAAALGVGRGRGSGKPVLKNPIGSRKTTKIMVIVVCLCECGACVISV